MSCSHAIPCNTRTNKVYLPGGGGPLMNIIRGGPRGGIGGLMCIGSIGGAPPRLKKLLEISSGGAGKAGNIQTHTDVNHQLSRNVYKLYTLAFSFVGQLCKFVFV